jgi:hypothetical protein
MAGSGLQTRGLSGSQKSTGGQSSDIKLDSVPAGNDQQQATPKTFGPQTKRANFSVRKEDPALIDKMSSDEQGQVGTFNGTSSFIDGYLRINKRRYGRRGPYVR